MKLSSGAAPIGDYRAAGVTVGLGTDGEKENNNLDMIEELKFGSLLAKLSTTDPAAGDPWDLLEMATREGAVALGIDDVTGTLEVGKEADIVAVDVGGIHCVPLFRNRDFNAVAHLVFSASGRDVTDVWVQGRRLVEHGEVTSVDVAEVAAKAQEAAEELFARRRALGDPVAGPAAQLGKRS
jgi:5-methylthioadenosine/S-adenosylhomocysteine deaminase